MAGFVGAKAVKDTTPSDLVNMIVGREVKDLYVRAPQKRGREDLAGQQSGNRQCGSGQFFGPIKAKCWASWDCAGQGRKPLRAPSSERKHQPEASTLDGRPLDMASPEVTLRQGVGLIARDRTEESIAPALSIRENTFPQSAGDWAAADEHSLPQCGSTNAQLGIGEEVGLRPNDPALPVEALSGGNQQKVIVGRWLATGRKLLIAEDPTAGVDVGAKSEIYRLVARALDAGLTVIVVSTDFEEVAHICHRALVFSRGVIVAEIAEQSLTTQSLIHAASASEAA